MARYLVPDTKHSLPNTLCWLLSLHASPHPRLIQPQPIAFDVCFPVEKVFLDRTSESESLVQLDGRRHHVCRAAEAVAAYLAQLWKRFVQRILGKIMVVKKSAQIMQRLLNADQTGKLRVLALGFIVCFADNRVDPGENQDVIFASAIGRRPLFYFPIKTPGVLKRFLPGKVGVRRLGCQLFAAF